MLIIFLVRTCCGKRTNDGMVINPTPLVITSEVHRTATGTQITPAGDNTGGTAVYPPMPTTYPSMPAPFPAPQPYADAQQYLTQSGAAVSPSHIQFPPLPPTMQLPIFGSPSSATVPDINPPSYDQAITNDYPSQAPYNPDFKGGY
ncbi:uncharacterized protein LOC131262587 isoform X2 [Anopheles coustani]|nr:uncharacterized protein LOC131262587 isoform X2 [Anopheles coustani]